MKNKVTCPPNLEKNRWVIVDWKDGDPVFYKLTPVNATIGYWYFSHHEPKEIDDDIAMIELNGQISGQWFMFRFNDEYYYSVKWTILADNI